MKLPVCLSWPRRQYAKWKVTLVAKAKAIRTWLARKWDPAYLPEEERLDENQKRICAAFGITHDAYRARAAYGVALRDVPEFTPELTPEEIEEAETQRRARIREKALALIERSGEQFKITIHLPGDYRAPDGREMDVPDPLIAIAPTLEKAIAFAERAVELGL